MKDCLDKINSFYQFSCKKIELLKIADTSNWSQA